MKKRSKRIVTLMLCMVMVIMTVFTGCGNGTKDKKAPDQNLKVAISSDINSWNIDKFPDGDGRFVWSQIYDTLIRLDEDLNPEPALAESWEEEENGKVWIFHLKEGVKFHDGTPFDAKAVEYSYGDKASVIKVGTMQVESVEAIDDYTVKFTCMRPMPLPSYMTHIAWPIVSPNTEKEKKPIGTGPFKFEKYEKGKEVVLTKNEDYWGEEPKLDKVTFKIIPDANSRIMALKAGDIDMCLKVPENEVAELEKDKNIDVNMKQSTFTDFIQFNCKKAPLDDLAVRKAVAYTVDCEAITKNILKGIGEPANGRMYSPCMLYSDPNLELYKVDEKKAGELLDEAGWKMGDDGVRMKDGKPLEVDFIQGGASWSPKEKKIAESCQAQLDKVGFKVNLLTLEPGEKKDKEMNGDFDMIMRTGYFVWGPYPHHVKMHFSKCFASHYENPEYNQLVIAGEKELDEEKKAEIYSKLQKMVIDEVPAYYIVHEDKIVATRSCVKGYKISAEDPWLELKGVYIE